MKSKLFISLIFLVTILLACEKPIGEGERLYVRHCGDCHGAEGEGLRSLYPPLKNSDYLDANFENLACIIVEGLQDAIVVNEKEYDLPMAGVPTLNDVEVANIINFIDKKMLSGPSEFIGPAIVKARLADCE